MLGVAVGWQLYELTGSALDLGLVGLVQFVPMILLTLIVGQVADRCDRRLVVIVCEVVKAAAPGDDANFLAVAAAPGGQLWAVGGVTGPGADAKSLAERLIECG